MLSAIIIGAFLSTNAFAQAKVADFYKESKASLELAKKEKTFGKKLEQLKKLESSFKTTLKEYEEKMPDEGNDEEKEVSLLFYTLEPVFNMNSTEDCVKTEHAIKADDRMGRGEEAKLTPRAEEALNWVKVLCKK